MPEPRQPLPLSAPPYLATHIPPHLHLFRFSTYLTPSPLLLPHPHGSNPPILASGLKINCARNVAFVYIPSSLRPFIP